MPSTQSAQKTAAATRMAATSGSRRSAVIATGPTSCARSSVATAMTALVLGDENSPKPQPSTSRQATVKASGAAAESVASRPRPAPSVRRVRFREIGAAGALAALRAGEVDVLRGLPHTALPELRRLGGFRLESRPALEQHYLWIDSRPRPGGQNPLADVRVRQALPLAIDREALVAVLGGQAAAAHQLAPPGVFGHVPGLPPLVPLYRAFDLYAVAARVRFTPRLDGRLLVAEMAVEP